ncbi:hypothetical protein FHG87_008955 [Trinorchestia longiramus]|nr:hypothetical protein FHG87_008955 [Trinorchestia longiramus]
MESGCNFRIHRLKQFQHHLTSEHGFVVVTRTLYFENLEKFQAWKNEYEKQCGFSFCMLTTKDKASHVYYYCSLGRVARYVGGKRRMSNQCPTRLVLNCNRNTGQVYVELIEGHYGHPLPVPNDGSSLQLTKTEIQDLKVVMRMNHFNKDLVQQHLNGIKMSDGKKELFMKEFEKKRFHEIYRWAEETFIAESPVTDWQRLMPEGEDNAIIIHKRKGEIISDLRHQNCHHRLNMEDFPVDSFMLGVMTDVQKEILLRYSSTIVLELVLPQKAGQENSTKQLYVLVMDHLGRELQVGFFVVNCPDTDTRAFRSFFLAVKAKCGDLKPNLLIVNERTCLFRSWVEVFNGHVPGQLLSPWFIEAEFNSVMIDNMIPNTLMQKLEELFVTTVREFSVVVFEEKLATLINTLNAVPGAQEVLNYVSETLLPCLNHDSSSPIQPKWAHHAFPKSKEDIALSILTFTAEKLKGLHGYNSRKLGRCVYLMMQRQLQRRQLRNAQKSFPGSRTSRSISADITVKEGNQDPAVDALREQEKQTKKTELKERCQKLACGLKNVTSVANLRTMGEEILKVTKLFNKLDTGKYIAVKIKTAEDIFRSLSSYYETPTVSQATSSTNSEHSSSCIEPSKKRVLEIDRSLLTVKRNYNQGPIALSSYSSVNRPNKRPRLLSRHSSFPGVRESDTLNSHKLTVKNDTLHPTLNSKVYNVLSSSQKTLGKPITSSVRHQDSHHLGNCNVVASDRSLQVDVGSTIALEEIISPDEQYGSYNTPVVIPNITLVSNTPTVPPAIMPPLIGGPSFNSKVPSQCSTIQRDGGVSSAVNLEENLAHCSSSHVVWQIKSEEDDSIYVRVKEENNSDVEGLSPQKTIEITAADQDRGSFAFWS